jgi:hypothetical protein
VPGRRKYATHIPVRGGSIIQTLNIACRFDSDCLINGKNISLAKAIGPCSYLGLFNDMLASIGF